ncbi:MAG: HEAT repeat domain-containing protein [Bradymonadales bacterium]|nr:HEAT repeat domain-containing protein [Bradymonadales bacterium]
MLQKALDLLSRSDVDSIRKGARLLAGTNDHRAIEALLVHLKSRHEMVRDCVREVLNQLDVAPVLRNRWRSDQPAERADALELAVPLSHPGLLEIYREAADLADAEMRRRVAVGLRHQNPGDQVMDLLARLVADEDRDVRWWAIDTLSLLETDAAWALLRMRLKRERDDSLRPFIEKALSPV